MRIKDIPLENRPRERLARFGASVLSDAELLAVVLQKGTWRENVVDMSNRLLSKYCLSKLSELSLNELQEINGIGPAKAMQIKALFELSKRSSLAVRSGKPITCAKDVFEHCSPSVSGLDREQFIILHLDAKNIIIKDEIISIGTLTGTIVHPREVFKTAIKENTYSVVLVHNHPSGDPSPSEDDTKMTEKLLTSGEILGIKVLDHVIIGKEGYYSFKDNEKD